MSKPYRTAAITAELTPPDWLADIRKSTPAVAKRVQEWLCLHGHHVAVDGQPGPATAAALADFQRAEGCGEAKGALGKSTWEYLVQPMQRAFAVLDQRFTLRKMVADAAFRHLAAMAREAGGDNCGPWVRAYCGGKDGAPYRWCAGFVSTLIAQACEALDAHIPLASLACDGLREQAITGKRLVTTAKGRERVETGDVFLCVRNGDDAFHTGIVTAIYGDHFETIEGNTNEDGSSNGYTVARRTRGFEGKQFITLG